LPNDRAERPEMNPGDVAPSSAGAQSESPRSTPGVRPGAGTYFLGRYRVVDEIGVGGMASVHLARVDGPGGFQKWVAIKKIHPHLVEDESFVQMFLDEARVAARISHPNVATVFDLGKHEDTYWIAMEYLHGEPLREVMRQTEELGTAMPPEIACRVIADAAEGLHAAHELLGKNGEKLGLVHRDVTPHNLFVTYDGTTKVVDFGIAKFDTRMSHTRAGTLKGKLAYMSPEQVHGEGVDRRTDIFALGVVLWELTTGRRLFRMDNDLDTLAKVQECIVPPPSTVIRGYPVDLEQIVMKALSKNPDERFYTAREVSRALQSLLMRRGLFIGADEVASYTRSIFYDRIQKREAHLRWATDVTQTIDVGELPERPHFDGSGCTSSSEVPTGASGSKDPMQTPYSTAHPPKANLPEPQPDSTANSTSAAPDRAAPQIASHQLGTPEHANISSQPIASGRRTRRIASPRPAAGTPPISTNQQPSHTKPPPPAKPPVLADADDKTIRGAPAALENASSAEAAGAQGTADVDSSRMPTLMKAKVDPRATVALGSGPVGNGISGAPRERESSGDRNEVTVTPTYTVPGAFPPAFQDFPEPPARPASDEVRPPLPSRLAVPSSAPVSPPASPHDYPSVTPPGMSNLAFVSTVMLAQQGPAGPVGVPAPLDRSEQSRSSGAPFDYSSQANAQPYASAPSSGHPTIPRSTLPPTHTPSAWQRFKSSTWAIAVLAGAIVVLIAVMVIAIVSAINSSRSNNHAASTSSSAPVPPTGASKSAPAPEAMATSTATPPVASVAPAPQATPAASSADLAPTETTSIELPASPAPNTTSVKTAHAAPAARRNPQPAAAGPKKAGGMGAITVVCMPKCSQIIDNGSELGAGHIFNRPVPSGRHALELTAPNGVRKSIVVEVVPDKTNEVRVSMAGGG